MINDAFPVRRRDIVAFPVASSKSLDCMTFSTIRGTPFGKSVEAWLGGVGSSMLTDAFVDTRAGVVHTQSSFLLLLREMVRATNENIAAGRFVVQPAAGVEGVVEQLVLKAAAECRGFFKVLEALTGSETQQAVEDMGARSCSYALVHFDRLMCPFQASPCVASCRQRLSGEFSAGMRGAETTRRDRAAILLEVEKSRVQAEKFVVVVLEQRSVPTGRPNERRETARKQGGFHLGTFVKEQKKRTTIWKCDFAEFRVDLREKKVRGDGTHVFSEWCEEKTEWRNVGNEDTEHITES